MSTQTLAKREESEDLITWAPVEGVGVVQTLSLLDDKRFYRSAH